MIDFNTYFLFLYQISLWKKLQSGWRGFIWFVWDHRKNDPR